MPWWEFDHQVAEMAHMVGVPGPLICRLKSLCQKARLRRAGRMARLCCTTIPRSMPGRQWPWPSVEQLVKRLASDDVVLVGNPGPAVAGAVDLRGQTSLGQVAAIIGAARCYVGIDSGLMWIAGSLGVPTVGLYGTEYVPICRSVQPLNAAAEYLESSASLDQISVQTVWEAIKRVERRGARHMGLARSPRYHRVWSCIPKVTLCRADFAPA